MLIVTKEQFREFKNEAYFALRAPDFMPSAKRGCCDGKGGCCRHSMRSAITWIEMEQLYDELLHLPRPKQAEIADRTLEIIKALKEKFGADFFDKDEISLKELKDREATMEGHSCPLLDPDSNSCLVYNSRPLICAAFGCSIKMVKVKGDKIEAGKEPEVEPIFVGCDSAFEAAKEHPEYEWPNFGYYEARMFNFSSPTVVDGKKVWRTSMISKPIPFWLSDFIPEGTTRFEDTNNTFEKIRNMVERSVSALQNSILSKNNTSENENIEPEKPKW